MFHCCIWVFFYLVALATILTQQLKTVTVLKLRSVAFLIIICYVSIQCHVEVLVANNNLLSYRVSTIIIIVVWLQEATLECETASAATSPLPLVPLDEAGTDSFLGQGETSKFSIHCKQCFFLQKYYSFLFDFAHSF